MSVEADVAWGNDQQSIGRNILEPQADAPALLLSVSYLPMFLARDHLAFFDRWIILTPRLKHALSQRGYMMCGSGVPTHGVPVWVTSQRTFRRLQDWQAARERIRELSVG